MIFPSDPNRVKMELLERAGRLTPALQGICIERQALEYIVFLEDLVEALLIARRVSK